MASCSEAKITSAVLEGVKTLLNNMGLDGIKTELDGIKTELSALTKSNQAIAEKQTDLQSSLIFTQGDVEDSRLDVMLLKDQNQALEKRASFAEHRATTVEKELRECKSKLIDLQSRSMKDNITFHGIKETENENTRQILIKFMKENLKIPQSCFKMGELDSDESGTIWIKRCHRFGQTSPTGTPRPIVAVMVVGRDVVLKHTKNLSGSKFYVNIQTPPEISESRKKLSGLYRKAKADGKKPRYGKGDAVIIDRRTHRPDRAPTVTIPAPEILTIQRELEIYYSAPLEAGLYGNKFVAHSITVKSAAQIPSILLSCKCSSHTMASADHHMYAARITKGNKIQEFSEDDGEHGGSHEIMKELRKSDLTNKMVIVSRWASGTQLGPKRFLAIQRCAAEVLQNYASEQRRPAPNPAAHYQHLDETSVGSTDPLADHELPDPHELPDTHTGLTEHMDTNQSSTAESSNDT